jgi:hypothetical protein
LHDYSDYPRNTNPSFKNPCKKPLEHSNGMIDFWALLWQTIDATVFSLTAPQPRRKGKSRDAANLYTAV